MTGRFVLHDLKYEALFLSDLKIEKKHKLLHNHQEFKMWKPYHMTRLVWQLIMLFSKFS